MVNDITNNHNDAYVDRDEWFRVQDTTYAEASGTLQWSVLPSRSQIYFAYFAPYSYERHLDLIARCAGSELASVEVLGSTLDGRDIDLITCGKHLPTYFLHRNNHEHEKKPKVKSFKSLYYHKNNPNLD